MLGERLARDAAVLLDRAVFDAEEISSAAVEADVHFASEADRANSSTTTSPPSAPF